MALLIAYEALGIRRRTLITTPYTFIATAAVTFPSSKVSFVVVLPENACINPLETIEKAKKDAIISVVRIFGYPASVDVICENTDISVVEDCTQARGAILKGKRVSSYGDVSIFSFYPSENMTVVGDGGMLVTNDEKIYKYAPMLRDNGRISRYVHTIAGLNLRLNTINAAIDLVELKYLD